MDYCSGFDDPNSWNIDQLLPNAEPFWLHGDNLSDSIVICLHGYTATPFEARPIADATVKLGMDAVGPLFPAHGIRDRKKAIDEMRQVCLEDIFNAVRDEITIARKLYKNVFIYGQSMGGAVSLVMAEENLVDACAITAPAIKLPLGAGFATKLFGRSNLVMKKHEDIDYINISYDFNSAKSGKQLQRIALHARGNLSKIECPIFHAHSKNDSIIDPVVTEWVASQVKGPVEVHWYNESDHTMPLDVRGKDISLDIAQFFKRLQ